MHSKYYANKCTGKKLQGRELRVAHPHSLISVHPHTYEATTVCTVLWFSLSRYGILFGILKKSFIVNGFTFSMMEQYICF